MTRDSILAWAAAIVTLGLIAAFSLRHIDAMWALNLLAFLPGWWLWLLAATAVLVTIVALFPSHAPAPPSDSRIQWAGRLWSPYAEIVISLAFGFLFYRFMAQTHFLGDGYTLISVFGVEGTVIRKWPEPGSYFLARLFQHLLGGETRQTLIRAMQLLSIGSGAVFVFFALRLPRYLSDSGRVRALTSVTLISSGAMLMFFGYVEYYHVTWAIGMIYLTLALRYLKTGRGAVAAALAFVVMAFVHFQTLALALGIVLIAFHKYFPDRLPDLVRETRRKRVLWACLAAGILFTVIANGVLGMAIFLPLFDFHNLIGGYAVFSGLHLLGLINEWFVIYPGILILMALVLVSRRSLFRDDTTAFLGLSSFGALLFLITVDPVLGMGRDWDLMSFPLLPIGLYLIRRYARRLEAIPPRLILIYALVCVFATAAYVTANIRREPSEARFASLLEYYGPLEKSGWAIFDYYYLNQKRYGDVITLSQEMLARGIREADAHYAMGEAYRRMGDLNAAVGQFEIATTLEPKKSRWLNDLGQAYIDQGKFVDARTALRKSRSLEPSWNVSLESLALLAIRQGDYPEALLYADTLFMRDSESPGGHLIYMVVELNRGDKEEAALHYEDFVRFGKERSDYARIRAYYGPMFK